MTSVTSMKDTSGQVPEVVVRRCRLTVRRRGGWSWGAAASSYVDAALGQLEAAILEALAEAATEFDLSDDVVISEPLRIQLSASGDLTGASKNAIIDALGAAVPTAPTGDHEAQDRSMDSAKVALRVLDDLPIGDVKHAVAEMLVLWSTSGSALRLLCGWPRSLLVTWVEFVARLVEQDNRGSVNVGREILVSISDTIAGHERSAPPGVAAQGGQQLAARLAVIAAVTAANNGSLPSIATQRRIAAIVGKRIEPTSVAPAGSPASPQMSAAARPAKGSLEQTKPVTSIPEIVPVLPFLVLDQLARIGYLDAVVAASEALDLRYGPHGLAAAIVGKVLPEPHRGWLRSASQTGAVVVGAGGVDIDVPCALVELAGAHEQLVPILSSSLVAAYVSGRSVFEPVAISDVGTGGDRSIICGEPDGLLPIAWSDSAAEHRAVLVGLGEPPTERSEAFAELATALGAHRALPGLAAGPLERHLAVAVGTALGLLAKRIWPTLADPSPLVALNRLGDLDGRVTIDPTFLRVSVPRGQRWLDLQGAELLRSTPIPWMPGGVFEVGTW